jgi:hypothetical protein
MRSWLTGMAAIMLCVAEPGGATGRPIDCGPTLTVVCLSTAIFSLAKTLPDDSYFRPHVSFAVQELAPGNIKTALEYIATDTVDPAPWDDIDWIAQAGRFDRAISRAKRSSPVARLGGLLAVAAQMLDKNDRRRATRIVDEVERELPSIAADKSDDAAGALPEIAAEIRARLGQIERAARLLGKSGVRSLEIWLSIARKYPAAASLRDRAWREAERANEAYAFRLLLEDAISRGDQAGISRAAPRASARMEVEIDDDHVSFAISLASVLLGSGFPDLSARLVKPWPQWVNGKDATHQFNTLCGLGGLIPVLAGLAQDQDVQMAAHVVSNVARRSQCLSAAAAAYFRLGRPDVARKFDTEALGVGISSPIGEPELKWDHDAALHNLALARADRGDIQGALDVADEVRDEEKILNVRSAIVRRAIDNGHGAIAGPAIQAMEQQADAAQDASLLLQAANYWYQVGEEEDARRDLTQALKMTEERQSPLAWNDQADAAELMWRINGKGKAEAMLEIVDKLRANDPAAIDRLVAIMTPVSPAVAVQLAGRQVEVERRIVELANIAIQIAGAKK